MMKARETLEKERETYRHCLRLQRLGDKRRVVACPNSRHCWVSLLLFVLLVMMMMSVVVVVVVVSAGI